MTAMPISPPEEAAATTTDRPAGRLAAGQDPAKRRQILDGAKRCFLAQGFEAASMNDITAEAGVSKGTLYVYFSDKEDLFGELIERERTELFSFARDLLDAAPTTREGLIIYGKTLTRRLTSDHVIRAQRMVLGVVERMPGLGRKFFGGERFTPLTILMDWLEPRAAAGELQIPDLELAARQFLDLSMAGLHKQRLFGNLDHEPTEAELDRVVQSAADMFLSYYGRKG